MLQDSAPLFMTITSFGSTRAIFIFMLFLNTTGPRVAKKFVILRVWMGGSGVAILLNFSREQVQKSSIEMEGYNNIINKIQRKINIYFNWFSNHSKLCLVLSVFLFGWSCYHIYNIKEAYDNFYGLLLILSLFFTVLFTNQSQYQISDKWKKRIKFLASYSFTLFLLHYSIFWSLSVFVTALSPYWLFFIGFILSNILSIIIAYFTEKRANDVKKYILNKIRITEKSEISQESEIK